MLEGVGELPIPVASVEPSPKATPQRFCHLIPGISATADIWKSVENVIKDSEIDGNRYNGVQTHDSSVSIKPHNPHHFENIADSFTRDIESAKKTGGVVDIITTSLGTNDLMQTLALIKKQNPEDLKYLRLFLISPWGLVKGGEWNDPIGVLKGWSEGAVSVMRFGKLLKQHGLKGGDDMGFLSFQTILPAGVDPHKLSSAISTAYADRTQVIGGYPTVESLDTQMIKDESKKYADKMKPEDQEKLKKIDESIRILIAEPNQDENWIKHFRVLNKERGKVFYPYVWKFFEDAGNTGNIENRSLKPEYTIGQLAVSLCKHPLSAANNVASIIHSTFGGDYKKLIELMESGVSINFVAGELDLIDRAKQYERFMDEFRGTGVKPRAATMLTSTHISSYSSNQEALVRTINLILSQPISQPS